MLGLIVNVESDRLPPDSPYRTREEVRHHAPVFTLRDGFPVFEVWFWHSTLRRWFVMSKAYDAALASAGVVYFDGIAQLKAQIAHLMHAAR